jgi:alpha-tubulin suppressor-like RCC1 family protein
MSEVVGVAAGYNFSLALKSNGTVWGWGLNYTYGVLGDGTFKVYPLGTIVQAKGLTDIVAIDAGMRHSLALKSDGTVWAWGLDRETQLGDASTDNLNIPTKVIGLDNIIAIAGGLNHTLALKSDGTVWACGRNLEGELGRGNFNLTLSFVNQVINLTDVVAIAAGSTHNLALKADGTVWAWGANSNGQLGNITVDSSSIPVQVNGITKVVAIAAGGRQSLALVQSAPILTTTSTPTTTSSISTLTITTTHTITSTLAQTSTLTTMQTTMLTSTLTQTYVQTSTSTQVVSSSAAGINSWWIWLIFGLFVVAAAAGIVWRIRNRSTG